MAQWIHISSSSITKTHRTEKPDPKRRQRILWARNRTKVQHIEQHWSCGLLHLELGRGGWEFPSQPRVKGPEGAPTQTDGRQGQLTGPSQFLKAGQPANKGTLPLPCVWAVALMTRWKFTKPIPLLLNWVWDIPRSLQARPPPADGRSGWRV